MGLAVIEASACDVPAFGTPVGAHAVALAGIEGSACLDWNPERWREALAPHLAVPDPRVDGRAAAERFSADRWPRTRVAAWRRCSKRLRLSWVPILAPTGRSARSGHS